MISFENFETGIDLILESIQNMNDLDGFYINREFVHIYKNAAICKSFYNGKDASMVSKLMIFDIVKFLFGFEGFLAIKGAVLVNSKISKAIENINLFKVIKDNKIDNVKISNRLVVVKYEDETIKQFTFDELKTMIIEKTKDIDISQLE